MARIATEQEDVLRILATAILLALPTLAQAQEKIPDAALREAFDECVPACQEQNSYAFCASACGCVVNEMGSHWTMADFRARGDVLSRDADDAAVRTEVERIADYCALPHQ